MFREETRKRKYNMICDKYEYQHNDVKNFNPKFSLRGISCIILITNTYIIILYIINYITFCIFLNLNIKKLLSK